MCTRECHFATMVKHDYNRVLKKIEVHVQTKMVQFLQQIPYLGTWSRKQVLNLQYFLQTKDYPRGHWVYKEG